MVLSTTEIVKTWRTNQGGLRPANATGAKKKTKKQKKNEEKGSETELAHNRPVKMKSLPAEDQEIKKATELFSLPKLWKRLASKAAGTQTGRHG